MTHILNIAIAQLNFLVGDIEGNADRIIRETHRIANEQAVDCIVFPELALSGYPPEDLLFRPGFYKRCQRALNTIQENIGKTAIILGYPASNGDLHFNKAACIHHGKIIADYAKQALPNDTVFDEKRYFTAGTDATVFELKGFKIGLLICEDLWHANPIKLAKEAGAELIISVNASPYDRRQVDARKAMLTARTQETALPIVYANLVGGQDELVFDGGSFVINQHGEYCGIAPYYTESTLFFDVQKNENTLFISKKTLPAPLGIEAQLYETLKLGVRDYIQKNNFPGALIGLSGGVDSALTLAIAADAIGADKVTAVIMPSKFTAQMSVDDAIAQANALGVEYHIVKIDALFELFLSTLTPLFNNKPADATEENLQARIRGMILMALSNKFGKIVLTTGNKSEMSVGYATLYGDMAGGFAVIKDVAKTWVYQLSHYRNAISSVIPERVLTRAPTAELAFNQTDQDKLPPYDILDDILERYIEKDEEPSQIMNAGFEENIVDSVVKMIGMNEYKRRQAAVGVRLTKRAFGKDRRYPITSGYVRSQKK